MRKKLKQILSVIFIAVFIFSVEIAEVYASNGLTAYVEESYGNNIIIEGNTFPNTSVTIKLIRTKDNNIRYTNETKSDKNGRFKFAINAEAEEYKALVSATGLSVERKINVNDINKGTVTVRVEGKTSTLLKNVEVNVEAGYTTYYMAITKALKDNNISYTEKDKVITGIGDEDEDEDEDGWIYKIEGGGQILPSDLVNEYDKIVLVPGNLQKPKITRLKVSPVDKDIVNGNNIEITKGSSFIVKLEQLYIDMFGDINATIVPNQMIKFNNISKRTDKNGEVIFVANNEGKFDITCEPTINDEHDDLIRPIPVVISVKSKENTGTSSSGGSSGTTINKDIVKPKSYSSLRFAGSNRYETSEKIGNEYVKNSPINGVILALGNNFPDALSGSVLSNKYKMPIILVGSSVKDSSSAISYIEKNLTKDKTIYILGGTGGITEDVEKNIKSKGYTNIKRLGGIDRFETNGKIIEEFKVKEGTPVVIASGENFPDALSISAVAGAKGYPILLVTKDNVSDIIKYKLKNIKPSRVFVIGGIGSISDKNVNTIKKVTGIDSKDINRIWGKDRYETSLAIAKHFEFKGNTVTFANGQNFPDALSGSALSALKNAPLVLINNNDVLKQRKYIDSTNYTKEIFYGGRGVISNHIIDVLSKPIK